VSSAILTFPSSSFTTAYRQALEGYVLAETGEEALMHAYELGRRAIAEHCNILDLVATHQGVMLQAIMEGEAGNRAEEYLHRGEDFLAEVMAPFEMMHRGFTDTIRQLQEVNTTLEQRVEERTRALQESRRRTADLARLYHILSGINSAIVRLHDRSRLFREACRIAVEQGGYRAAWISPSAEKGGVTNDTWCHCTADAPICELPPHTPISTEVSAAMNRVYNGKRPVIRHRGARRMDDKLQDDIGHCSYALFPLIVDDKVTGVFTLFSNQEDAFNKDEMRLLLELAGDLSFALDHIRKEEQLDYLANHDSLTGLPNRNLLLERLSLQLQTAGSSDTMVALLLVDLVHFSDVNDTYGRHVGDNLLRQVGNRLSAATGNRETVARLSADRFALTLTNLADAGQVAHRLEREVLNSFSDPFKIDETEIHITVQVGLALFPSDAGTADTLYKNSEIALKRAQSKQESYLLYDPAMNERIIHSVTMEAKLRKAIEREELLVYYQPKVAAADGRISGMEALLRYADPQEGIILPSHFIPLMEETGMIIEIGNWVMRRAAEDLERWRQLNLDPPRVAVNVSPIQLRHKNFLDLMREMLPQGTREHGLDIEITESAVMEDVAENIPKLAAVREMGFGIAVDDFGTGYSSLSYLSRLPVDALKIDRSFIIDITERPNCLSIVTTIITLAHALDMKTVAEGVDLEEQAKLLRLLRCDLIQGNLYGPPLAWDEITERLQLQNR
jgi:diguanylate cyclase (GGDEF)-like protein